MQDAGRQGEVRITTSVGQNLHFRVDPAKASTGGVGERKISVHETIARLVRTFFGSQASMAKRQLVAKFREHAPRVLGRVGVRDSMMQMNLDLSPARVAMLRDHFQQAFVVLLRGIEISVNKGTAVMVAPAIDRF